MTWYTFFKSVHVTAAAVWFGGALMIQAFAFRIVRTGDARRQAEFAKDSEVVGMRVFIPATWILLLAGIGLVVLLTVIVNMVVKPAGNAGWFWGLLAAMVVGIAAVLGASSRGKQPVAAPATE